MGWKLDDNTRSGIHYLLLGVLVIGVPAALLSLFDLWHTRATTDGSLPLGVFHNGYIIFDGERTAVADTTRAERLAYACAISLALATSVTGLLVLMRSTTAWRSGRWTFAIAFSWCIVSALFLPRTSATLAPGEMHVHERSTIIGDITWPFFERSSTIQWSPGDELFGQSLPVAGISDVFRAAYYRTRAGDTLLFATTGARTDLFGANARSTPSDAAFAHMGRLLYRR